MGILDERRSKARLKYYSFLFHPHYRIIYRYSKDTLFVIAIHATRMEYTKLSDWERSFHENDSVRCGFARHNDEFQIRFIFKAAERENRSLRERLGQANEERYGEKRQRVRKRKDSGGAEKP